MTLVPLGKSVNETKPTGKDLRMRCILLGRVWE